MEYWQILILAIIQGAAELLPVSSSAHVILAAKLMGHDPSATDFVFLLVMLHTGTMFAVIVYFWRRWRWLLTPTPDVLPGARRQFLLTLVLATSVTGMFFLALRWFLEKFVLEYLLGHPKGEFEVLFRSLPLIAAALAAVGVLIIVAGSRESSNNNATIDWRTALWIGLVQGVCLPFRGFSRSGATISAALLRGAPRPLAEDFSFALAVLLTPPALGWQLWNLVRSSKPITSAQMLDMLAPGLMGMVFSFLAGLAALYVLSAALEAGRWRYFGYYCIFAAVVMMIAAWMGF